MVYYVLICLNKQQRQINLVCSLHIYCMSAFYIVTLWADTTQAKLCKSTSYFIKILNHAL